jgi:hypothetical protein
MVFGNEAALPCVASCTYGVGKRRGEVRQRRQPWEQFIPHRYRNFRKFILA